MAYVSSPRDPWNRPVRRVDTARHAPMAGKLAGLGAASGCPECTISSGGECAICPDDASDDFPECAGCQNGVRQNLKSALSDSILVPVVAGVLTTLCVAYLSSKILRQPA